MYLLPIWYCITLVILSKKNISHQVSNCQGSRLGLGHEGLVSIPGFATAVLINFGYVLFIVYISVFVSLYLSIAGWIMLIKHMHNRQRSQVTWRIHQRSDLSHVSRQQWLVIWLAATAITYNRSCNVHRRASNNDMRIAPPAAKCNHSRLPARGKIVSRWKNTCTWFSNADLVHRLSQFDFLTDRDRC